MAKGKHRLITLTTDFGMEDGNVGVMKGVICSINPSASIVDLTHDIPPQDIADAAYVLRRAYRYFPQGTIHIVVVDPGVGSERRAIAVQSSHSIFVAPDNGVLTYVLQDLSGQGEETLIVNLTNPAYWLPEVSNVFHGRDIFAPVAAHLSLGVEIGLLGEQITDVQMLPTVPIEMDEARITGHVAHVDHFGNLLTNIPNRELITLGDALTIRIAERDIAGLQDTFSRGEPGELIAYVDSSDHLAIAVVNGSARQLLGSQIGTPVRVTTHRPTPLNRRHRD